MQAAPASRGPARPSRRTVAPGDGPYTGGRARAAHPVSSGVVSASSAKSPWPRFAAVVIWAIAFGLVEAVVVVYLRKLFGLQYQLAFRAGAFQFPHAYLGYERARETATMVMLLGVGYLAGRTWWQRFAFWILAFGVWDIFYYVWLFVYLGWPASPGARDLLFLIPGEWWAPVWLPALASCVFIAVAVLILAKTRRA